MQCNTDYRMCLCLSCYRKEKAKGRSGVAAAAKGCKLREKATKTIEGKCSYMKHGCDKQGLTLCQKRNHEYSCTYRPYGCPVPGCGFKGPFLYDHIHQHHVESKDAFSFKKSATLTLYPSGKLAWVLLERNSSRIILLQLINCAGGNEPPHQSLRVLTFGPPPEQALNFTMEIGALLARKPVRVKLSATMVWRRSLEEPIMAEERKRSPS